VLPRLLAALSTLDYPRSKLQAVLVVEAEDDETRAALARSPLPAFVEAIVAPPGEPRTKPRALNIALKLARGAFTTVYYQVPLISKCMPNRASRWT
jgi:cellulose synthase/poly-beta-1,6-N-acetylglucosamine synthase-like glycosyltransferase